MLIGEHERQIDDKHRVVLPPEFRPIFAEGAVLTKGLDGCIQLVPSAVFEAEIDDLMPDRDVRAARRRARELSRASVAVTPDSQGRVTLADRLREFAGITERALLVGFKDRVEIWSPERIDSQSGEVDAWLRDGEMDT